MAEVLLLPDGVAVGADELYWEFFAASGPGGQKVNKTASAVRLSWNPAASAVLREPLRSRILTGLATRLRSGWVAVTAQEERSQAANRRVALLKLGLLLAKAAYRPAVRRATKPTRGSVERRLEAKRRDSRIKALRRGDADR